MNVNGISWGVWGELWADLVGPDLVADNTGGPTVHELSGWYESGISAEAAARLFVAPRINGEIVSAGCLIDSHHGQYMPDMLADQADAWGIALTVDQDPRIWRHVVEAAEDRDAAADIIGDAWDRFLWAADALVDRINDHAWQCRVDWVDGDLFVIDPSDDGEF